MACGLEVTDEQLAADAYREAGPGQAYLGTAHTMRHFRTANYQSELADTKSFEQWTEDGSLTEEQRANALWKQMLADYEAPHMDQATDEALKDFMARKKAAAPDQWH